MIDASEALKEWKVFLDDAMEVGRQAARERARAVTESMLERRIKEREKEVRPSFRRAVTRGDGPVKVISEIKRTSPVAGVIRLSADVGDMARRYERSGASAISVLTSEFGFGGRPEDLLDAARSCALPLLRKDFISLGYQVLEARAYGASAVLLISEALDAKEIETLSGLAFDLGMDALVEAHSRPGVARALAAGSRLIGINNRDLSTLQVDIQTTERLRSFVPDSITLVSESGIRTREEFDRVASLGVDAVLIGEALMKAPDPGKRLQELAGLDGEF